MDGSKFKDEDPIRNKTKESKGVIIDIEKFQIEYLKEQNTDQEDKSKIEIDRIIKVFDPSNRFIHHKEKENAVLEIISSQEKATI